MNLSTSEREALAGSGRASYWRFKLSDQNVEFDDAIRGATCVNLQSLSDPILRRSNGEWLYAFTSVVDDIAAGTNPIIRGADHITNTGVHIDLMRALDAAPPTFAHHNLLVGAGGAALSKRDNVESIRALRHAGIEPEALFGYLATIGTARMRDPGHDRCAIQDTFNLASISRNPAQFDRTALGEFNRRMIAQMPHHTVHDRLTGLGVPPADQALFWDTIRENIDTVADSEHWWRRIRHDGDDAPVTPGARPVLQAARALLPPAFATPDAAKEWIDAVRTTTGLSNAAFYGPLRTHLTQATHGPALSPLVYLIGTDRIRRRLDRALGPSRHG